MKRSRSSRTVFLLSISTVFKNLQTSGLPPVHLLDSHQIRNNNTFLSISTVNVSKRCYTRNMHTCKNIQTQPSLQYVGLCINTHYNNVYNYIRVGKWFLSPKSIVYVPGSFNYNVTIHSICRLEHSYTV